MTLSRRALLAVGLMSAGLVLLLISGLDDGWTTLSVIGVACLAVAIVAELVTLVRSGPAEGQAS